ncbi:hypothetical protein [Acinetobacter sp.]|uniref:hypothetical protein n=1 Tax=Acinetobacter sp. TaxID=472 RepID=UPI0035AEF5C1
MIDHYGQFILGLQYNAQRFFDNKISDCGISHPWCDQSCAICFIRDVQTNALLHDSVDHLVAYFAEHHTRQCSLYPFDLLFDHAELHPHHHFEFLKANYPIAVFHNNLNQAFALVQIQYEKKILDIKPIGDPREFWGVHSTQDHRQLGLFTIIELNQQQRNECFCIDQNSSWSRLINSIQQDLFEHPFSARIKPQFKFIQNLYFDGHHHGSTPLLAEPQQSPQPGLSLIAMLNTLEAEIKSFKQAKTDNSPFHFLTAEEQQQLLDYENKLSECRVGVICFTANHLNQENHLSNDEQALFLELQRKYPKPDYSDSAPVLPSSAASTANDKKPAHPWAALFALILIFALLSALLYGLYLLFKQFELIKFIAITIGIMVFLAIWSKK